MEKSILFEDGWGTKYLLEVGSEDIVSCPVPNEVLKGMSFRVSAFGGDLITTNAQSIMLMPSGFCSKRKGEEIEKED